MFCDRLRYALAFLLICVTASAQSPVYLTNLRCENLTDPVALEKTTPRLSWTLTGPGRGITQTSYHILVATSADKLARNEADLWDSGVITSDQSLWIPYGGSALTSRIDCFWKVDIRTTDGAESGWSAPAHWTMGLLQPTDRLAQWVGLEKTFSWDQPMAVQTRLSARYFRTETQLPKPIRKAVVYVCGLGLYELYLNGNRIGDQVLAPGPTEYDKRVFYNTYDVTQQLHTGPNALGITLGNGRFFHMRLNLAQMPETTNYGLPKFWLQLEVTYTDGTSQTVLSDTTWKVTADGPILANNEYDGEDYDATKELTDWSKIGYNDSTWVAAEAVSAPASRLESQPNPPIRIMQTLRPRSIQPLRDGVYIMDMGQNMTGWVRMRVAGPRGTKLTMRFGEILASDGSLYVDNLRSAKATDNYTMRGDSSEVWQPRFTYHGFRYVELSGFPTMPTVDQFDGCVIYDDMASTGQFISSNAVLNQIVHNADWGIRGNYRGMPTDCPQRDERHGWLGDRTTGATGESFLYNNQALYAKWLGDIEDAQSAQGSIPDVAPSYWKVYTDNITWPAAYVSIANMLYDQFGDDAPIRAHYASMKRWIKYIDQFQHEYDYWKDEYGDWAVPPEAPDVILTQDPNRKTNGQVLGSTHYYHILKLLERFATIIENDSDRVWFANRADLVKAAFNVNHWDILLQQYSNNTTTANVLPLAFDMVPDDRRQRVISNLMDRITGEYTGHISSGVVGVQWLMRTLTANGRIDLAYQLATNTTYPSWGYMAQQGATTTWELWNGNTASASMNSGNHVMLLGDLLIWLYENVGGIKAMEPAFHRISMHPTPVGDLTQVSASHVSPYGSISSSWAQDAKGFRWNVVIPGNCLAEVAIPASSQDGVWEGGQLASLSVGVRFLRQEGDRAIFEVGSGTYLFTNAPPANLTLQIVTDKRAVFLGDSLRLVMTIRNEGPEPATNVTFQNRLAPNLEILSAPNLTVTNGQFTGTIPRLDPGDQRTVSLVLRPKLAGTYWQSGQITGSDQQDPTSLPNSGTGDGEDDMATTDFRTNNPGLSVFISPNPNQIPLPDVLSNQPLPDPNKADLSLQLTPLQNVLNVGQASSLSLVVVNAGGQTTDGVSIRIKVPTGMQINDTSGTAQGAFVTVSVPKPLLPGQSTTVTARLFSAQAGVFTIQAEVSTASMADPDSVPNNGFTNGEDDTSQITIRAR